MAKVNTQLEAKEALNQELRRGTLVLAVLSQLKSEHYGYSLKRQLEEKGLVIDEGTLYPLMRRLESQRLLISDWRLKEARPRRYYRLSERGLKVLEQLKMDWKDLSATMGELLK